MSSASRWSAANLAALQVAQATYYQCSLWSAASLVARAGWQPALQVAQATYYR